MNSTLQNLNKWVGSFYLWTLTLTSLGSMVAAFAWDGLASLSFWFGAILGLSNFHVLAYGVFRLFAELEEGSNLPKKRKFLAISLTLRWFATALATLFILWYMPVHIAGLVIGVLFSLIGLVIASLRIFSLMQTENLHHG